MHTFQRQILLTLLMFTVFISSYSEEIKIDDKHCEWTSQMNSLLKEVSENVDSMELVGLAHIDDCPLGKAYQSAYQNLLMAEVYYYNHFFDKSLNAYKSSLSKFLSVNDTTKLAMLHNNIGLLHFHRANYDSALIAYNASLEIERKQNNKEGIAQSYQNMGIIYGKWKRYKQVFEYYNSALELYTELQDNSAIADVTNNMAVNAVRLNDYDLAFKYYKKAFEAYEKIGNKSRVATVASNLGRLFFQNGQEDRAEEYYYIAIDIFRQKNDKVGLVSTYGMLGEMYLAGGDMDKALKMFKLSNKYNEKIGLRAVQQQNLVDLYQTYKKLKEFELANEVLEKAYALKDSIYTNEQFEKLLELEKKYHIEKSQKELIMMKAREDRNRMYLWGVSIFFLLSTLIVLIWVYVLKIKERQRRLSMEHKVLRTQMNPHFIFNSLSALQCIILENNKEEAMDFVADFSVLMRLVLQYAKEEQITLKKEKEILENYMSLQNRRFDNKISYKIDFDEDISLERVMVPPMLTQPFLENAIEHGQLSKDGGCIHVKMRRFDDILKFSIEDNGIGIKSSLQEEKSKIKKHKSIALGLTKERLRLLNDSEKQSPVRLKVEDLSDYGQQGTRVLFEVPYKELN